MLNKDYAILTKVLEIILEYDDENNSTNENEK